MKNIYIRLAVYPLVVVVIFSIFIKYSQIQESETIRRKFGHISPMGNILQAYFYITNTKYKDDPIDHEKYATLTTDYELKKLYRRLNWKKQFNYIEYKSRSDAAWHEIDYQDKLKENYLLFWQTVRPAMRELYSTSIKAESIDHPVIHFRCSDSPFNKHLQYHMPKVATVQWMADQIKNRGFNKVTILMCNKHYSLDKNSCDKYAHFYGQVFADAGIDYSIECNSIVKDFALMFYSPLLVSLNQSSYSFMAGVAKNPKDYITCNMGIESDGKYYFQRNADWILDDREPLLHKEVADYNDTEAVINKLRS